MAKGVASRQERASHPMSRHYEASKDGRAFLVKLKCVVALAQARKLAVEGSAITINRLDMITCNKFDWDFVQRVRPNLWEAEGLACSSQEWSPGTLQATTKVIQEFDDADEEATPPPLPMLPEAFTVGKGKAIHLEKFTLIGKKVPYCRELPFSGKVELTFFEDVRKEMICKTCLVNAPAVVTNALDLFLAL